MTATNSNLPSLYDPFSTEAKWQKFWEEKQIYKADPNKGGEPYCIVIPPPNVTGSLHMGHAFESALIDTLVRYHRMKGCNTLWLPGTDHASIAVQAILENQLKAEGKTRYDLGREKFLERAWQWKGESGGAIVNQLRRLGVSVDWSRERFTLDEGLSKAVLEAFVRLYEEGLIYRGEYLVNWCPASQSAVSDVEVENQEVNGNLWHFRYPLTDGSGYIEVATTRPETMLGDTAVAVNPNDDRYKHLIGKTVTLPIMQREIPIVGDEFVDPTFGTGCVKVTPAHDPNDFEMGKRHNLPFINIMNKNGTLNENAGEFQGQDRFDARKNVVSRLQNDGFLVKVEDYKHSVPYSDRGKVPVEPLLSTQWFVKIRPMADQALEFIDDKNSPQFVPQRWTKVYRDWLVKLKDWCISRQLWWGHQIPAWYAVSETGGEIKDNTPFIVAKSEAEAWDKATSQFGENVKLQQDPDVLDTWFSAGIWPFSTLGWPEQTQDLATYYPTSTLVTGFDIIFFWVARMTMMGKHFTGEMPFKDVYIHGLVLDENGQKQSKSKGNGIDPLLLIDKYGTDALRYAMIKEVAGAGQDIRLEYDRKKDESASVEASRNFANKLWNAARFVMMNLDGQSPVQLGEPYPGLGTEAEKKTAGLTPNSSLLTPNLELSDRWILSRYNQVINQTRDRIDNYGLGEAAKGLYEFIWGDFCDQYIELVKSRLQSSADPASRQVVQQTLAYLLEGILKLLHPLMPHITEEIWQTLTQQPEDSPETISLQSYPEVETNLIDPKLEEQFELLISTIRTIRNLRAEADVKPGVKVTVNLQSDSAKEREILISGQSYIKDLAKVETLTIAAGELHQQTVVAKNPLRGLKTIGLIIVLLVFTRLAFVVGDEINHIPILGTFFQMLGLGYTTWFVAENLVMAKARQKLWGVWFKPTTETNMRVIESPQPQDTASAIAGVVGTVQVLLSLTGVVDIEALSGKIQKRLSKIEGEINSLTTRLNNPKFVDKAAAEVVQATRDALAEVEKQAEILRDRLRSLA
ncbi:valine--tRNA ligase [Plectonema radiosum NIES-515]|uniref:Valine--tRNA ligase n=1 Tax=Plectonema radiosum NIES-515 TaxID=2986073 RepID=A0ABT3B4T5_9CYAN|nr:valine--tRNA ligase [Plectonema radiosum]MCV3216250.1 valine--tRNA ligase [Plectonema radiosum NIES-515]